MAFQILDSNNKALTILELDRSAALFWKKEVDPIKYATPINDGWGNIGNWFDVIGYHIHEPRVVCTMGWDNVKCSIMSIFTEDLPLHGIQEQINRINRYNALLEPYFQLINYWSLLGYTPKQIED